MRYNNPRPNRRLFSNRDERKLGIQTVLTARQFHENAYMAGRDQAITILDVFVGLQQSRRLFNEHLRYEADREYIRGLLDALMPMMTDTQSFLRDKLKLERELRNCISDDFFDCAAGLLRQLRTTYKHYDPSEAHR
ncbi:hypothetical protein [Niveibacterium microcysteis]|uniref:Uncharacterized protein n=1 Tax=Niveibacterium microcysteis TaxID=2811415 RepID=A0ABX7MAA5_9RHOO|nr:hypothetical protein [Niveibacterium microcysteis]QSI78681.1 hypothetical protein JY500_08775 [Niveibacterium microcysteis]